ncbi:hypothetical protein BY458DRAFT_519509 [Sporodiniella umbellata]|nr:hypothetical protein BY458DRAFT_519509 [Sporodiniella umbellata]
MNEDDYYYEEESNYVLFDLGTDATETLVEQAIQKDGGCRIIGLEEGQPFLQVGHQIYEGEIDDTIGTHLLFEIQENKRETEGLLPLLSSMRAENETKQSKYITSYFASTEKVVNCSAITLKHKEDEFEKFTKETKLAAQQREIDDIENEYI